MPHSVREFSRFSRVFSVFEGFGSFEAAPVALLDRAQPLLHLCCVECPFMMQVAVGYFEIYWCNLNSFGFGLTSHAQPGPHPGPQASPHTGSTDNIAGNSAWCGRPCRWGRYPGSQLGSLCAVFFLASVLAGIVSLLETVVSRST